MDRSSVDATITISRPSLFPGGPGFHVAVTSTSGVTGPSFTALVPLTHDGDPPYTLTVVPNGRSQTPPVTPSDAEVAPPYYTTLTISGDTTAPTITLDDPSLQVVTGVVEDANALPLAQYRVSALGRWDPNQLASEVSTVAYTGSDGTYSIVLAAGVLPGIELVAAPYATTAPTLTFSTGAAPSMHNFAQPAGLGAPIDLVVPVEGMDSGGQVSPVVGARVTITGLSSVTQFGTVAAAKLVAEDITDPDGNAHLTIVPGGDLGGGPLHAADRAARQLELGGVVFDEPLTATASATLATHRLDPRIAIRGTSSSTPAVAMPIPERVGDRAAVAEVLVESRRRAVQAFVTAIPPPTTVTPATGDFVLWVDPIVGGVWSGLRSVVPTAEPAPRSPTGP